jgi:hypothetical protein
MRRLLRHLALLSLLLAPAGCEWCQAPDTWVIVAGAPVRASDGTLIGEARVSLVGFGEVWQGQPFSLSIEMTGPPGPDSTGGPLQGWTGIIRLESAGGEILFQGRRRRGSDQWVFERIGTTFRSGDERYPAVLRSLLTGHTVLVVETLDDPLVPLPGPLRATLPVREMSSFEGGCT